MRTEYYFSFCVYYMHDGTCAMRTILSNAIKSQYHIESEKETIVPATAAKYIRIS